MGKISIILSGGAAKGCFQIGALKALLEKYSYDDIEIITGTSVGSLNGAMVAQKNFELLFNIWDNIKSWKDIYKNWTLGYVQGFFKGGLVSFSPMEKIINKVITDKIYDSNISFYACDVNLNNGDKTYTGNRNEKDLNKLKKHILASASMAPFFMPIKINDYLYTDGGCKEPIPVRFAVENAKESDKFFVILTNKRHKKHGIKTIKENLFSTIEENVNCLFDEVWENDISEGELKYWYNDKKFIIIEPEIVRVKNFKEDINHTNISLAMEDGYKITKSILDKME